MPRHETFDPAAEDSYDVTVLKCHACAARERKAYDRNSARERDAAPLFGEFYVATPEAAE